MAVLLGAMGGIAQAQETVSERERVLLDRIERLERRLAALETGISRTTTNPAPSSEVAKIEPETSSFLRDTTFNVTVDGYYSYNFNRPIGGVNLLRAYDVSKFADGFLGRVEYRRDYSNQPFFLTEQPGILKKEQNTATLGLVWWFGRKEGTW